MKRWSERSGDVNPSRRSFLKAGVLTTAALASGSAAARASRAKDQPVGDKIEVKVAGYAYDRVRAIQDGRLGAEGCAVSFHPENIYQLNQHAFGPTRKYEVSEVGLIPFVTKFANEDFREYTLLPVFISRIFRHRNIFVRTDRGIEKPEDLRGKRIGTPGYGMSAATWIRGFLQDLHGVRPEHMHWIETTTSSYGGELQGELRGVSRGRSCAFARSHRSRLRCDSGSCGHFRV